MSLRRVSGRSDRRRAGERVVGSTHFADSRPDCRRPTAHHCRGVGGLLVRRPRSLPPDLVRFNEARPIVTELAGKLPPELNTLTSAQIEATWPAWIERHDREIRARLEQGDEDTIVNWLLFGTSFTSRPRAVLGAVESGAAGDREQVLRRTIELISARLEDLLQALAAPGTDERRLFARAFLERKGLRFATAADTGSRSRLSAGGGRARGNRTGPDRSGTWRDERRRSPHGVRPAVHAVPHARSVSRHIARVQLLGRAGTGGDEGAWVAQARRRQTRGDRRSRTRLRGQGRWLRLLSSTDAAAFCGR